MTKIRKTFSEFTNGYLDGLNLKKPLTKNKEYAMGFTMAKKEMADYIRYCKGRPQER